MKFNFPPLFFISLSTAYDTKKPLKHFKLTDNSLMNKYLTVFNVYLMKKKQSTENVPLANIWLIKLWGISRISKGFPDLIFIPIKNNEKSMHSIQKVVQREWNSSSLLQPYLFWEERLKVFKVQNSRTTNESNNLWNYLI